MTFTSPRRGRAPVLAERYMRVVLSGMASMPSGRDMFRDIADDAPRLAQISLTEERFRWLKGCVVGDRRNSFLGLPQAIDAAKVTDS